ncbi:hypothetical protein AAY473_034324 [Plecturocebus cupreus]
MPKRELQPFHFGRTRTSKPVFVLLAFRARAKATTMQPFFSGRVTFREQAGCGKNFWVARTPGGSLALSPRLECNGSISQLTATSTFQVQVEVQMDCEGQMWWLTPAIPALWKAEAGRSHEFMSWRPAWVTRTFDLLSAIPSYTEVHFGKPRRADHLRSGIQDQSGQRDETPSLLKIQKITQAWWHMYL